MPMRYDSAVATVENWSFVERNGFHLVTMDSDFRLVADVQCTHNKKSMCEHFLLHVVVITGCRRENEV